MIRISRRGKIGLSALAAVIVAGALAAVVVVPLGPLSHAAHAAPRAATVSYNGVPGTLSVISKGKALPKGVVPNKAEIACANDVAPIVSNNNCGLGGDGTTANKTGRKPTLHRPAAHSKFNGGTGAVSASHAPKTIGVRTGTSAGVIQANFNGVSNDDNATTNGFVLTPPDQGLCVGNAGAFAGSGLSLGVSATSTIVIEPVNESVRIFSPTGHNLTGVFSLATLFNDPGSDGDVSCLFDPGTQSYYFV
jgi:hypothetical protein